MTVESNGTSNGAGARDANGRFVDGGPYAIQPGETRNPAGFSAKGRFREAVRRRLKRRMRAGDEDELDQLADEVIVAATGQDKNAVAMLREIWAREDGPHQTGPNGEAGATFALFIEGCWERYGRRGQITDVADVAALAPATPEPAPVTPPPSDPEADELAARTPPGPPMAGGGRSAGARKPPGDAFIAAGIEAGFIDEESAAARPADVRILMAQSEADDAEFRVRSGENLPPIPEGLGEEDGSPPEDPGEPLSFFEDDD